jgi:hypothetical protein
MNTFARTLAQTTLAALVLACAAAAVGCKSSGGRGVFGPSDETEKAVKLVDEANTELTKIKALYLENEGDEEREGKRTQLEQAMQAGDPERVRKITSEIIDLINEGTNHGRTAIDKISEARDLNIHADYKEYLRLKEEALRRQIEAFAHYRQLAQSLRDNFDPKNAQARDKVRADFDQRTEKYREIMEKARDLSSHANELFKESRQRHQK